MLIPYDAMTTDMISDKKLNPVVTEIFLRVRKLIIYFAFITQSYFKVPQDVKLNSAPYFIAKTLNRLELPQIDFDHWLGTEFKGFNRIYRKCTANACSFAINDTTLWSDNTFCSKHNFLEVFTRVIMTIDKRIKNEKLQYQHYYQEKLINMIILQVKEYYFLIRVE